MSYDITAVLARVKRLTEDDLRIWMQEGWVRPVQGSAGPVFDDLDVARLRLLCDLCLDLSLPDESMPVVLTLIDRLQESRRRLRLLSDAIAQQPEPTRHAIIQTCRTVVLAGSGEREEQ